MTAIVINAISVREGGSLVVLRELLTSLQPLRPTWQWYVIINSQAKTLPDLPNVTYCQFPNIDQQAWKVRLWYETGLLRFLKQVNAALLFSHTNYLPYRHTPCPTLLLVQHAGHFSTLFCQLTEAQLSIFSKIAWRLKGAWVRSSITKATQVTVQTQALASQITKDTKCNSTHIQVIAHGCGQAIAHKVLANAPLKTSEPLRIGYITKAGVQKNFSTVFKAIKKLKNQQLPLTLVLTLSTELPYNRTILSLAEQYDIMDMIENHGELSPHAVDQLYQTLNIFLFPSLCESFGFPMVEAMSYGLPLLIADIDSNIEVAGLGGIHFSAQDANDLAQKVKRLANDKVWFQSKAQASLKRSANFHWGKSATETLLLIDNMLQTK